jgi:hypothetical protein
MKISKITLALFLTLVLGICSVSEINSLLTLKTDKFNENNTSEKPKKKAIKPKKKAIKPEENSFGKMVKAKMTLENPPWKVERCDQIIVAPRQIIPDHEDFTKRRDIVFTMTAYYLNIFSAKNPDKLLHSILFSDSKRTAIMQRGARGCVLVDGGLHHHAVLLCGKNKKEGENILAAIEKFSECRGGKKVPPKDEFTKFKKAIRACGLNSGFKDPKTIKKKIAQLKKKLNKNKNHLKRATGFFHPGFSGVPGTD